MAQGRLTDEQVKELDKLNQKCKECIERASIQYQNIDRKTCMICPTGMKVHQLDQDNVDGHNSGRYEAYFTT